LDREDRVWVSLLTGAPGFVAAVDETLLLVDARPAPADPLETNLGGRNDRVGLLVLDPQTRQRMRFNGRGLRSPDGIFLMVDQVYGNCPKYIQRRRLEPDVGPLGAAPRVSRLLDAGQQSWVARADTLFIGSFHPAGGADASHRGGFPGFVSVHAADRLSFPDYPGNGMFNTLGNLTANPRAGLLFVDFTSGDVLQLTGRGRIETDFAVAFEIDEVRETRGACPLRSTLVEYSPANPSCHAAGGAASQGQRPATPAEEDER
jgi:hypothetical protein